MFEYELGKISTNNFICHLSQLEKLTSAHTPLHDLPHPFMETVFLKLSTTFKLENQLFVFHKEKYKTRGETLENGCHDNLYVILVSNNFCLCMPLSP